MHGHPNVKFLHTLISHVGNLKPDFDAICMILARMTCALVCFTTQGLIIGCDITRTYFLVQPVLNDSESCSTQSQTLAWKRCFRGKNFLHKEAYVSKRTQFCTLHTNVLLTQDVLQYLTFSN